MDKERKQHFIQIIHCTHKHNKVLQKMKQKQQQQHTFTSLSSGLITPNMDYINYLCSVAERSTLYVTLYCDSQSTSHSFTHSLGSLSICLHIPVILRYMDVCIVSSISTTNTENINAYSSHKCKQFIFSFTLIKSLHVFITGAAGSQSSFITSYCTRCIFHLLYGEWFLSRVFFYKFCNYYFCTHNLWVFCSLCDSQLK